MKRIRKNRKKTKEIQESYDSIRPGYYHYAMLNGSNLQKFWHRNKFRKVIECAGDIKGKRLLDLGCGPGTLISLMPKRYREAVGLDFSRRQIDFAKRNFGEEKIRWIDKRIEEIHFGKGSFDVIFMVEVIEHLPEEKNRYIFSKIFSMLRKKGRVVITTPNYKSLWPMMEALWNLVSRVDYKEQHVHKFDIPKMRRELSEAGFRVIRIKTIFFISPFLSMISPKLAEWVMGIEERLFPAISSLILAEAEK